MNLGLVHNTNPAATTTRFYHIFQVLYVDRAIHRWHPILTWSLLGPTLWTHWTDWSFTFVRGSVSVQVYRFVFLRIPGAALAKFYEANEFYQLLSHWDSFEKNACLYKTKIDQRYISLPIAVSVLRFHFTKQNETRPLHWHTMILVKFEVISSIKLTFDTFNV